MHPQAIPQPILIPQPVPVPAPTANGGVPPPPEPEQAPEAPTPVALRDLRGFEGALALLSPADQQNKIGAPPRRHFICFHLFQRYLGRGFG